ncbi:dTDP-4-dehydrorhamnose reductase [Campylobacter sp. Cr9]|uniref:dTDP-4-dehydrorhamnose reductase n=1 Tax=Campylobacter sp. Cr9 TaxID=2735728 RepID=UPI003014D522|nr:dTDP-4-dehydrorhamnose reductase [Campylobacter sp. Cr9]
MANILITGANGQLGSELKELSSNYNDNFYFVSKNELDISNSSILEQFIINNKINTIINTAAYTAVDKAEDEKDLAYLINHKSVEEIAKICAKHNVYLIHISTDYVFDGTKHTPYKVDEKTNPLGVYGRSKELAEQAILNTPNLNASIIRTSWVYSFYGKNFLKTMLNLFKTKDSLGVVSDQIGSPTYAKDLAGFILSKQTKFKSGINIYHYSNEGVCSWYDFAYFINELSGNKCKISPIKTSEYPTKATRPSYSVLDKDKIKKEFEIGISHWSEGVKDCLKRLGELK